MNDIKSRYGIKVTRLDDTGEVMPHLKAIKDNIRPHIAEEPPNVPEEPQIPFEYRQEFIRLNCVDVCNHIMSCPVCSKFYNTDKTMYILAIALISIVCIILMKRMLEK